MRLRGNDYNVREAGGVFGDLGTLIPFLVGYLTITQLDPVSTSWLPGFKFGRDSRPWSATAIFTRQTKSHNLRL
jgi:hypothetical protein